MSPPANTETFAFRLFVRTPPLYSIHRYLDQEAFVNAIAPAGDADKIKREQYAVLFKVADIHKRGRISWDDFTVFETILKRPVRADGYTMRGSAPY
jgi:hypothetical protein